MTALLVDRIEREDQRRRESLIRQDEAAMLALAAHHPEKFELGPLPADKSKAIIKVVAMAYGFTAQDIIGPSRLKPVVMARKHAMRAIAEHRPHLSTTQIARLFRRSHWTVLHHLDRLSRNRRAA